MNIPNSTEFSKELFAILLVTYRMMLVKFGIKTNLMYEVKQ